MFRKILRFLTITALVTVAIGGCQIMRNSGVESLPPVAADTIRLGSWNVHYIITRKEKGSWGTDHWDRRKVPMDKVFKALNADIIAFQEMESFSGGNEDGNNLTRTFLSELNPEYAVAAVGPWQSFPSTQPFFYKKDVVDVLEQGWFFFSETPDQIYSRTFNGSYPAFATWVQFHSAKSDTQFRIVNVHVDFSSRDNRTRSVELIVERIKPWLQAGEEVVIVGDLNARLGSSLHKMIEAAGLRFVPLDGSTYHFNAGLNLFGAIDHIAYTGGMMPTGEGRVLRAKMGETWASDHYPIVADFRIE